MAHKVWRVSVVSALILSFYALSASAHAEAATAPADETTTATKPVNAKRAALKPAAKPESDKSTAAKPAPVKEAPGKTSPGKIAPVQSEPKPVKKTNAETLPVIITVSAAPELVACAPGLVAEGSVIAARDIDSCGLRRVQVISGPLAFDGPTPAAWLRDHNAPPVVIADAVKPIPNPPPIAEVAVPVSVLAAIPVPVAIIASVESPSVGPTVPALETLPVVTVLPESPASADDSRAAPVTTVAGFSVGSFTTTLEAPRRAFKDTPLAQTPLGFHLRVAGQVADGNLGLALSKAGLPLPVVHQVLDSFAADGKMPQAVTEDIAFDVLYRASSDSMIDPVLTSAELSHGSQSRRLYYYVPEEGTAHLIDQQGRVRLAQGPDFIHPMPGYRMTSGFGWRQHPVLRARKFHKGVDWSAPRGTPVVAAAEGIVETVKFHRGYGKYIRIVHDDRTETVYGHLDQFAKGLKPGQAVRQGQVIGRVGRTGVASGNHLYFELVVDGRHVDPLRNLPALLQDLLAEGRDKEDQQRFVSFADTLLQSVPATAIASDAPPAYRTARAARTEPEPEDIP
jgi:murein DD-endopeptidase MepM/ murein hydrolase activator NlpD